MKKKNTFVIIGNSAAGLAGIEGIREVDKEAKIINISGEPHLRPYSRCLLSYYLAGAIEKERLWIRPQNYYKELEVEARLGIEVESIDVQNKKVRLSDKSIIPYDKLLFATGASAKKVALKGIERRGVFYLRTLEDADGILKILAQVKNAVILGGGLIGIRAAYALKKQNKDVRVIVKSSHVFSQMLDFASANMLRRHLESNGIQIFTGLEAVEIFGGEKVEGVLLDDGNRLPAQLVIIGKGVSPNLEILKGRVEIKEGILADAHLETSQKDIFTAGDVAEVYDILEEKTALNALWPAAVRQGKIAGLNLAGNSTLYSGSCGMNAIEFFGLAAISFGLIRPKAEECTELLQISPGQNIYRKIVLKNNKIVGGIFVNDIEKCGIILELALEKVDVRDIKELLVDKYFDFGKVIPLIKRQKEKFSRPEYSDIVLTYN